jgi:hypothetical protein
MFEGKETRTLRYLLVALWPAYEGAIAVTTVNVARRVSHASVSQTVGARDVGLKQFRGLGGAVQVSSVLP